MHSSAHLRHSPEVRYERLPGDAGVNAIVTLFSLSVCVRDELENEATAIAMLLGASTVATPEATAVASTPVTQYRT